MIPQQGIDMLKEKGYDVTVYQRDKVIGKKALIRTLKKGSFDAVLSLLTDTIDAAVFDAAPTVKLYANYATGFDNIDLVEAAKRGITIANAPTDASSEAVAEHTVALMLASAARIVAADEYVRRGKYKGWAPLAFVGTDIFGKTLGLVGAGRIGERVARYCKALGMQVIYTDVSRNERMERDSGAAYCASVDELLPNADIVSLHVPLLDSTRHLIDARRLSLMKKSAHLINTARGAVIDEAALVRALKEGRIAGAALDVFEFEPKTAPGLAKLQNAILTPHIASASVEARDAMATIAATAIIDFFEGRTPATIVRAN